MLEAIGVAIVSAIEQELIKHAPEIQAAIVDQLDKLATLLFEYVQENLLPKSDAAEQTKLENKD